MPNIPAVAAYESGAREFSNSEFFTNQDSNNLGIAFNLFKTRFTERNPGYFDDEDLKKIDSINESLLREYRDKAGINNFIPKAEEWDTYYAPRPDFSLAKNADEKIKMSIDWKAASLEKATDLVPSLRKDFDTHLEYITNNDIRESVFEAKKSKGGVMAWLDDKTNRTIEGGLTMVAPFIEGSDRWLAENLPEDPSTNEDFSSQIFAGVGQLVTQAGIALGTSAIAGPEAGVAAIGTIYSARALVEGYKEEMRKSGNAEKALDVGIAGIPGAAFETFADSMLFGMGKSGKAYLQAFKAATTREAKEAILKEAFPKMGKEALKNGLQEATLGSVVSEWSTGFGRALASGDDSYIPTVEQLGKGALVEFSLGAGYSSLNSMAFDGIRTEAFAKELADKNKSKSADIFKALAGKNYQEAVEIAARDYPTEAAPAAKPVATTPAAATPNAPVAPNTSGIVIPQPNASSKIISASVLGSENYNRLVQERDRLKKENGTDAGNVEKLKRITESIEAIKAGTYQEPESFTLNSNQFTPDKGFSEVVPEPLEKDSHDVILDNGKSIKTDGTTIFVSGFDKALALTKAIERGEVGLSVTEGKDGGTVMIVSPVGGTLKHSVPFTYSDRPEAGKTAISLKQVFARGEEGSQETIVTNFSILGKVDKSSKSKESKQKDSEAFDKLAAKEDGEVKDSIKEASIKEAKELVESIGNNTSFSDEAVNGEGGLKQVILDKIKIFNSIIGTSPDKLDDVIDAKDRLLKALAEAEGKITSSPSVKPVRGNVPLFQAKMAEQKTEDQLDRGFVMPKPILQGTPTVGSQVSYEGYEGTLQQEGDNKYTIETGDGKIVEVADIAGVSLVKNAPTESSELSDFIPDETPVDLDTQVANQEVTKAQLAQAFFSPTTNDEMSITDQFGNEYVPHNESLSKNFETDEDGGLEVLVRNKANPGKIIRLTGPQALQAQEAFLENVTNLEKAGFKVSLDSKFTGKKKTPAEKLDDEIKQEVEVVQKAKKERKKKAAPVKMEEPVVEPTNDEEASKTKEFTQEEINSKKKIGEGSESEVYEDGDNVIKVAESYNAKETLAERVVYALRAEKLLGNLSGLRYAGFRRGKNGVLNPVFSQRKIEGESASKEQVKALFEKYGWTENPNGSFSIVTPEGRLTTLSDLYDGGNVVNVNGAAVPRDIGTILEPIAKPPTPSNITSEPEAIFESVTDEGVVVETHVFPYEVKVVEVSDTLVPRIVEGVVPATEPVALDNEAKLLKEIERTKKLLADDPQDKEGWSVTLKEQEDQLTLLQASGQKNVTSAVQAINEELKQPVDIRAAKTINELDGELKKLVDKVIYKPIPVKTAEERLEELTQRAKDAANKVISDKVDDHIATIENPTGKKKWEDNKNTIVEFISKVLSDSKNARDGFVGKLSGFKDESIAFKKAEEIAASLDAKVKTQIAKDQKERLRVSELEKEHLKKVDEETEQLKDVAKKNKIKYSIGSEQPGATIDPKEAQDYIAKNHPSIETVSTRKTTEDGHQWRGRTDFTSGTPRIAINISNIRDLAQLKNVIHEELAHIAYNDPSISTSLKKIIESTKLQEELGKIYESGEVFEESVVKRMADLVDSYTEKGTFDKLFTAIKSYVKDKLGITLNDNDLSYIAYRAIVRAGKVTSWSGQTKFNKVEASNNTSTQSSLFEPDDDILSVVNGKISEEKKRTLKNLKRAIRKKLEKKLIIDEPQAWNALKAVNYRYLDGEQLKTFNSLLWQFVRTRSKSKDPGIGVRTPTDTVIAQATELAKAANQGHFNALQLQHDFLEGKDFQNDYQGDIDKVSQLAKDERGMKDSDTPSDKDADSLQTWQLRMFELQEEAFENRDYLQDRLDEQFPSASNITNNPIIAKRAGIYTETVDDVMAGHKEVAKQYINSLMSDPTDKTWRELRKQYYGLQDFLADGYLNVEDFVSGDMAALLQGKISEESFVKMYNAPWRSKMHEGASSFYTNTRTMGTEVAELAHKLTSKFRAGILAAERLMADFIDPTLNEFMEKAVALNGGKPFDGQQLNLAGIYGRARQFKATESVTEGILKSKAAIMGSLEKDTNSIRTGRKEAALIHSKFTSDLYAGIDANTPNEEALGILEANAERLLPSGLIGYVKDVVDLFEVTKPLSRFTSEFGLGRPFDEVINYIPSMAINKDGTPVKTDGLLITNTSDDIAMGVVGEINKDTNMQQSGGSSTKIRKGFLPEGMVYAWNINHEAHNRMRLNLNDYLTLPQRRELNNIISGKGTKRGELAKLLKDDGQQERVSHIQRSVLTMWTNTVQASNYVSEGQGFMNWLSNLWASTKLASLYQLPGQIGSNTVPYFIVHAGSPKRIKYLFDAYGIILKKQFGMPLDPRLDKTVERVLSVIRSRSQEQFLDKSIALDRTSNQTLEKLKSSKLWDSVKGINNLREKVLFAPFKFSDYVSGAPMMLANIMHHEETAGRATGWEGLTYNDDSFIRSLDETERFIGIGAASRRGVWTNNKNGWMSITRNVISAFSSHRVNNATNFAIEYARIKDGGFGDILTNDEKLKSLRYIMGIAAQSAVFSAVKWGMIAGFYNILTAAMGEEENEDELEKEYRKLLTGNYKPGDKKILEAEIAMREKIRNEFTRAKENNTRTDIVLIRGLQDVVANTFLIPAVSDMPLNMVIHAVYDQYEADRFKEVKEGAVTDLEEKLKKAKASKNTNLAIQIQKDLSRWNAQEAIPLVYEQRGVTPMDGLYGGVVNEASKFMEAAAGSLIKAEAMSLQDALLGAGLIGLSQPDINRWARMYSKIEEHEADFAEKLQEIKEKAIKKSRE